MDNGSSPPVKANYKAQEGHFPFPAQMLFSLLRSRDPCSTKEPRFGLGPVPPSPTCRAAEQLDPPPKLPSSTQAKGDPLPRGLDSSVQVDHEEEGVSGRLVMALRAKPSPGSPPQAQLVSPPPPAGRAGRCRQTASPPPPPPPPVEPSATLTLSPQRRGPPWTWRPGPPAASRLLSTQGARALGSSLPPPSRSRRRLGPG